ncbi:MAG: Uma2 family endonuclease [Cyanobacteria bacterium P01_F01_bin.150]
MVITLDLSTTLELTDAQFEAICRQNRELRLEKTAKGELVIMPPTGGETGERNSSMNGQLWVWNRKYKLGRLFDSSTGFRLPSGATRSPDASWVKEERWQQLTPDERQKFLPLCPDFAIELKSSSDSLNDLQRKMEEYVANGLVLGWLIDPKQKTVKVYQQNLPCKTINQPKRLAADPVLPGFVMEFDDIF